MTSPDRTPSILSSSSTEPPFADEVADSASESSDNEEDARLLARWYARSSSTSTVEPQSSSSSFTNSNNSIAEEEEEEEEEVERHINIHASPGVVVSMMAVENGEMSFSVASNNLASAISPRIPDGQDSNVAVPGHQNRNLTVQDDPNPNTAENVEVLHMSNPPTDIAENLEVQFVRNTVMPNPLIDTEENTEFQSVGNNVMPNPYPVIAENEEVQFVGNDVMPNPTPAFRENMDVQYVGNSVVANPPEAARVVTEEDIIYVADDDVVEERLALTATTQGDFQEVKANIRGESESMGTQQVAVSDVDASSCPICMEPWTSVGKHRISCLPCGHLFGSSCIRRWIQQGGKRTGKCPHCNKQCKLSEIRILYVPRIAVLDGEMQQELTFLRAENERLKLENKNLAYENYKIKEEKTHLCDIKLLRNEKQSLREEIQRLCGQRALLRATVSEQHGSPSGYQTTVFEVPDEWRRYNLQGRELCEPLRKKRHTLSNDFIHLENQGSTSSPFGMNRGVHPMFNLQAQFVLQGGWFFDMDASSQLLIVSQKASELGSVHFLTKISFFASEEGDKIYLPNGSGAIRDLHIAPASTRDPGRLALVASLGKKLSLVSFENNNVVMTYNLESPAWSCAWAFEDPHKVYTGLQNGKILIFDLRNTSSPINAINGLNKKPIHTLHSVPFSRSQNNEHGGRAVLGASCLGTTIWHVEDPISRPYSIPGLENQGTCISLAYCGLSDIAVASYRQPVAPQVGVPACNSQSNEGIICSQSISPEGIIDPSSSSRAPRTGSHFVLTKNGRNGYDEFSSAGDGSSHAIEWNFNRGKVMRGTVSDAGMPKSAIVTLETPERGPGCKQSLFAYGDELRRAVSLWDVHSLSNIAFLESHATPVLDVKHVQMQGKDILGCVSERKLQVYARSNNNCI